MPTNNQSSETSDLNPRLAELDRVIAQRLQLASELAEGRKAIQSTLTTSAARHSTDGADGKILEVDTLRTHDDDKHPDSTSMSGDLGDTVADLDLTALSLDEGLTGATEGDGVTQPAKKPRRKRGKPKKKKEKGQDSQVTQETAEDGSPDSLTLTAIQLREKANSYSANISSLNERLNSLEAGESGLAFDGPLEQEVTNLGEAQRDVTQSLVGLLSKIDLKSLSRDTKEKLAAQLTHLGEVLISGALELEETAEEISGTSSAGPSGTSQTDKGKEATE